MTKNKATVYGVGINDATYKVHSHEKNQRFWTCPYYVTWRHMLERCYSEKKLKKHPSYKGAIVCNSWLSFSNFRSWMMQQQWMKKELDKDLLSGGKRGKLYSPETCVFVSGRVNSFLTDSKKTRGHQPLGVCKRGNKYIALVCNPFTRRQEYLGVFTSPEIAQAFYIARKKEFAKQLSEEEPDERVKQALLSMDFSH
jgi:hypothetical protein